MSTYDRKRAERAMALAKDGKKSAEIAEIMDADPKSVRGWVRRMDPEFYDRWIKARYLSHDPAAIARVIEAAPHKDSLAEVAAEVGINRTTCGEILRRHAPEEHEAIIKRSRAKRDAACRRNSRLGGKAASANPADGPTFDVRVEWAPGRFWTVSGRRDCPEALRQARAMGARV